MADPSAKLTALLRKAAIDDHDEVLKSADAVLKLSKNNIEALHTRVVALIKLDRFEEALSVLKDGGNKLSDRCLLEKAYATYKAGHLTEAELLSENSKNRAIIHVAAQAAYRAGKFSLASRLYQDLSRKESLIEGEDTDLKVNTLATDAQLLWQKYEDEIKVATNKPSEEDLNLFEVSYNYACILIAQDDLKTASIFLKTARELCEASYEMNDEEKKNEIIPIMIQQAYIFKKIGNDAQAQALYNSINISEISEPPTKAIAQNNILASGSNKNPFLAQRLFDSMPNLTRTGQHSVYQMNILQRNKFIIDIEAKKYSGVANSTLKIISKTFPTISSDPNLLSIVNIAAHSKKQIGKAGLKAILPLLEKRPKDVGLILTVVQIYVQIKNYGQATSRLEKFLSFLGKSPEVADQEVRFAPGLVALLIALYRLSGRKAAIRSTLSKAASHWRQKNPTCIPILHAAGISLLESTDPEDLSTATDIFEFLRDKNPKDLIAIAGCVACYAKIDLNKVSSEIEKLTPVSDLISDIDINALENAGVPHLPISPFNLSNKKRSFPEENKIITKKRKLSQKRMPKNFDQDKKIDPERWLAARDRSNYRAKGKKSKKKMAEVMQGDIVTVKEGSDVASSARISKTEKNSSLKAKKKKGKRC